MTEMHEYNGIQLSENHLILLKKCVDLKKQRISLTMAESVYSSKDAALNGLSSLESKGILERNEGYRYRLKALPGELADEWGV